MNKNFYWILGVASVAIFAAVVFGFGLLGDLGGGGSTRPAGTNGGFFPDSRDPIGGGQAGGTVPSDNTKPVGSQTGGTILAKNFLEDPDTTQDPINPGHYYVGYAPDPYSPNPPPADVLYVIEYIEGSKYFIVALLQEPLGGARLQAEQYLMQKLGIGQADMCRLDYMVSTPARVSGIYSGTDLRFSFCPGATALP